MKWVFRSDDSGHHYFFPKDMLDLFIHLMDEISTFDDEVGWKAETEFMTTFDQFRISGGVENLEFELPEGFKFQSNSVTVRLVNVEG